MKAYVVIFATLLFVGCSSPKQKAAVKPADENAAVQFLSDLSKAQNDFHLRTRRYALTTDELIDAHFLKAEPSDKTGYDFTMRPAPDAESYVIIAKPLQAAAAAHSFFMDQTGVIHAEVGKEATASSPKLS